MLTLLIVCVVACDSGYSSQNKSGIEYREVKQTEPTATIITATPTTSTTVISGKGFMPADSFTHLREVDAALIHDQVLDLEIASTAYQKRVGLMYRTNMSDTEAMLFVYESEKIRNFWMKNVKIPLDVVFLDSMGVVVNVQTMIV